MIPIQSSCQTNLREIVDKIQNMIDVLKPQESYRITVEKRNAKISSNEIISEIAKNIPNKVCLDDPDWIILIEIIGNETGISILRNNIILSVEKVKRSLSE
jgi:tRNA acetyltransferase TAN1